MKQFTKELVKELTKVLNDSTRWIIAECVESKINQRDAAAIRVTDCAMKINKIIDLGNAYQSFLDGDSIKTIAADIADTLMKTGMIAQEMMEDKEAILNNVYAKLINAPKNRQMLKSVPYKEFEDLAIVFFTIVKSTEDGQTCLIVNDDVVQKCDLTVDELYDRAMKNTLKTFPPRVSTLSDALGIKDVPEGFIELYVLDHPGYPFGAVHITNTEILSKIASMLNDNLYIIPSSIQEVIIGEASMLDKDYVNSTINETNETTVEDRIFLSSHAYFYDRNENKVSSVY